MESMVQSKPHLHTPTGRPSMTSALTAQPIKGPHPVPVRPSTFTGIDGGLLARQYQLMIASHTMRIKRFHQGPRALDSSVSLRVALRENKLQLFEKLVFVKVSASKHTEKLLQQSN